jgi:hypothetical protein
MIATVHSRRQLRGILRVAGNCIEIEDGIELAAPTNPLVHHLASAFPSRTIASAQVSKQTTMDRKTRQTLSFGDKCFMARPSSVAVWYVLADGYAPSPSVMRRSAG